MRLGALLCASVLLAGCQRERERPLRTEPWRAPGASASAGSALGVKRYAVSSGSATLDLSTSSRELRGTLSRLEGFVDFDTRVLQATRATLRADLLSLELVTADAGADAALHARALDWLELSASRPERREQNRWAELRVTALRGGGAGRRGSATAQGELTLHGFRVPVEVDLEISVEGDTAAPDALAVRTRRPWLVPLEAHDLLPRRPDGTLAESELGQLGREIGRRAKVFAEIRATRSGAAQAPEAKSRN